MNILYLSYDGMTDPLGQSQVLPYLIGLTKEGHRFTLISFEKKERFEQQAARIGKLCEDHHIDWQPQFYTKKPPVISTLQDVRKMRQKAFTLHAQKNIQLVHCRSYLSALIGLQFKRKWGIPFIFDMRGFWADERVDGELWNLKNPIFRSIYHFFKRKELQFLQESAATVSLTHAGKEEMNRWELKSKTKFAPIHVIPCCTDLTVFEEGQRSNTGVNLGYLGSLGTWYLLDEMLAFFTIYQSHFPHAKFHFLTKDDASLILEKGLKYGLSAQNFIIEEAKREEIKAKIINWKASIFFIKPSFSKMASSPVKQGELMAMGIPVICNAGVGDSDQIVQRYKSGILVNTFDEKDYQKACNILKVSTFDSHVLRKGAEDYFSLEAGIKAYHKIYKDFA